LHRYIGEPFGKIYEKWAQQNNLPIESFKLKSGVNAFWLGDYKTAKYIVVYYHGGGFSLDGEDTHLKFWNTVHTDLKSSDVPIATLFLEYTLVPHATYPTQISEAVEAVNYVLSDLKRPASDIILAGDSAGGNMALAVLSHIKTPSPDLPPIILSEEDKLKALVLIAPWTSFRTDFPSAERNKYKDIVTEYAGSAWSKDYLAGKETSPYAEALLAPDDWWKGARVEQLLAVAGADELLVDPINEWFAKYKVSVHCMSFEETARSVDWQKANELSHRRRIQPPRLWW
jgi:acetyl esterase/lipase